MSHPRWLVEVEYDPSDCDWAAYEDEDEAGREATQVARNGGRVRLRYLTPTRARWLQEDGGPWHLDRDPEAREAEKAKGR